MVKLENHYITLSPDIVESVLSNSDTIYYAFLPETSTLLITSTQNSYFPKLHKCESTFLKLKNKNLDRNFQITSILMDYDIDMNDRNLMYSIIEKTKIVSVKLNDE